MKKTILVYLLTAISLLFLTSCQDTVRINIIGYPKLKEFEIKLNHQAQLIINGKEQKAKQLVVYPKELMIQLASGIVYPVIKVKINNNEDLVFKSHLGDQLYTGNFEIYNKQGQLSIINIVNIDEYFASVLGAEMGDSFPQEALKAQAIALKSYYYRRKKQYLDQNFDINNADGRDMVYRGKEFATPLMHKIIKMTKNQFLFTDTQDLALPLFHSTSCGVILKDIVLTSTRDQEYESYILTDDLDTKGLPLSQKSPYYRFEAQLSQDQLQMILQPLVEKKSITNIKLEYFPQTDCVNFMGFTFADQSVYWLKGYQFLSMAQRRGFHNLRSICFQLKKVQNDYFFKGLGFGHFCGMSQFSAKQLALTGATDQEILNKYYPDFTLKKLNPLTRIYFNLFY
ncbi:MAG: SpoIID/LytB domain-containing protein [Spirochaetes bacterium]|nr:SpoIID/LytB domain-containing protein [Spirochaetota bacterium]